MKNTWLYKKLKDTFPFDIKNKYGVTFKYFIASLITPLISIAFFIFSFLVPLLIIPSIFIDLYDLWYEKNEKRLKKKLLKNINKELIKYSDKLLKKEGVYYLDYCKDCKPPSLFYFLNNFLKEYNNKYDTIRLKDEKEICDTRRRRSLGDIYLISKYYFPNCTIIDVLKVLLELKQKNIISYQKCSTIKKIVFYHTTWSEYEADKGIVEYFNVEITFKELIKNLK